jgi:hypothetical protein
MSNVSADDPIEEVAVGDLVAVDEGAGATPYKVVHKDERDGTYVITFEADDGATFQKEYAPGTSVNRSLEAKWESAQSPTPHSGQ